MTDFKGSCHCKQTERTATLQPDHHCNTCKELSGGTYTLNQVILAKALKITKGDDLGKYTYQGASGQSVHCFYCKNCTTYVYHQQEVLQGIKDFKPLVEIFGKDLLPWEKEVANTIY
ncbi:hypothetical protein COCSADRAFT_195220 [Bipolaris sorokiniana ND90Pr]|uniref:CENP-V/GFA domain-containing protein n=1 Tax=Cochliobolus sativus (strain ND90Pr / ATCC 201652) TaxID=665912 RepID=M2RS47_COCSN|nr:uncharacterized protein COCSADRAFT_195220 [Bipolaris sorokiniana ND90Pr]EMD69404.1 hypothetical protein COCSADRAFT_195220 [Bipolaris sorokiniana ND90Pr]